MQDAAPAAGQTFACPRCGGQFSLGGEQFDPYYTWLGVPPSEQPANHYRLLGVQLFEPNRSVIENAADRQMKHLQSFKIGARAALSQKLLTEVAAARVQLLDASKRTAYDEQLRARLNPTRPQMPQLPEAGTPFGQTRDLARPPQIRSQSAVRQLGRRGSGGSLLSSVWVVVGGVTGLAIGVLIVFYLTGQDFLGLSGKLKQPGQQAVVPSDPPVVPALPQPPEKPAEPAPNVAPETPISPAPPVYKPRPKLPPEVVISSPLPEESVPPPPPTPPSNPQPMPPAQILAGMPPFVRLPALTSSETTPWFSLSREPDEPLTFALHAEAATLPGNVPLRIQAAPGDAIWRIEQAGNPAAGGSAVAVGEIRRVGQELSFAWSAPPAEIEIRRQLSNCLLELTIGNEFRTVQLREPVVADAFVIELDREKPKVIEFDLENTPPTSKLFMKVKQLVDFPAGAKLRGPTDTFAFTRPAVIEFTEMKGPELELAYLRMEKTGDIKVQLNPKYVETANRKYGLTIPSLQELYEAQQNVAQEARNTLNVAQPNLQTAQARLQQLLSNRPSNFQAQAEWTRNVYSARQVVERLSKTIQNANEKLVEANSRLTAVPEIRTFVESLHAKAKVRFLIIAKAGAHELVLVDGTAE